MPADVRAAVREAADRLEQDLATDCPREWVSLKDVRVLIDAVQAEFPADDDRPISAGVSGFRFGPISGRLYHESGRLEIDPDGAAVIVDAIGQRVTCIARVATRGQVRRLCAALQIGSPTSRPQSGVGVSRHED